MAHKIYFYKVATTLALVGVFIAGFVLFCLSSSKQVLEVNSIYLSNVASQKASYTKNMFLSYINSIKSISYVLEKNASTSDSFEEEILSWATENMRFDKFIFVRLDKTYKLPNGEIATLTNAKWFAKALNNEPGYFYQALPSFDTKQVWGFYAPVHKAGKIAGVMVGILEQETLRKLLETNCFGFPAECCIYSISRGPLACSFKDEEAGSCCILQIFNDSTQQASNIKEKLFRDIKEKHDVLFTYKGHGIVQGNSSTAIEKPTRKATHSNMVSYISALDIDDWVQVLVIPMSAGDMLVRKISTPSYIFSMVIAIMAVIYILYVLFHYSNVKHEVKIQNLRNYYLSQGSNYLKEKFIVVDIMAGSYEYLTLWQDITIPQHGQYQELAKYIVNMQCTKEEKDNIQEMLNMSCIVQKLKTSKYFEFISHINGNKAGEMWADISVIPVEKQDNKLSKLLFAIIDVTHLKLQERLDRKVIEDALNQAEYANNAKSDFLSRMSHDIRTPLNAITGMSRIALMYKGDSARVENCMEKITRAAKHLTGLINEVLDVSKIENGKITLLEDDFTLSTVADDIMAIIMPQAQDKGVNIKIRVNPIEHEFLKGDIQRLEQVLINIIGNAIKFTNQGGKIEIEVTELKSVNSDYCTLELVCEDNGIGMDRTTLEHIFEPFYRANNSAGNKIEGTGLGMTIAKSIAQMMGGDVTVESKLQEGTRVCVRTRQQVRESPKCDMSFIKNKRVLVISECKEDKDTATRFLKNMGAKVVHTRSFAPPTLAPDLILVTLDKITHDVAIKIHDLHSCTEARFIVAAYDIANEDMAMIQANSFLLKPMFLSKLQVALHKVFFEKSEEEPDLNLATQDFSHKKALLVEDNDLNREIAIEFLKLSKIQIDIALDGKEALDMYENAPEGFYDIILMDIQMPIMNGYEATKAIRESKKKDSKTIPIVAMTADAFCDDVKQALFCGMNDHIAKPLDIQKLLLTLKKFL